MYLMGGLHLLGLPRIKPIISKLWKAERFAGAGRESDTSITDTRRIALTLYVDEETNRVLFAQSKKDFIEVLFSFLSLPVGDIVRLCKEKTGILPLDNLYASVQALDEQSFRTAASKNILLRPRSAYGYSSVLAVNLDQIEPSLYYICSGRHCSDWEGNRMLSSVKGLKCICGRAMEERVCVRTMIADKTKGFLEDRGKFIISDDLLVLPATTTNIEKLKAREGRNNHNTKVRDITIGSKEVLQILKYLMGSRRPLTNALLCENGVLDTSSILNGETKSTLPMPKEAEERCNTSMGGHHVPTKIIKANLLVERSTRNIIGLEAREDLVDVMFSFLTIPLGSVVKLCDKQASSLGCVYNLHQSVGGLEDTYFKFRRAKGRLLSPKIAPKYGCKSQLLKIEEVIYPCFNPNYTCTYICYACFRKKIRCRHGKFEALAIINPKIPGQIKRGGGYLKKKETLIITNDLQVEYLDPARHAFQARSLDVHIIGIKLDKDKVSEILLSMMTSINVLDNVLHDVAWLSHDEMTTYALDN